MISGDGRGEIALLFRNTGIETDARVSFGMATELSENSAGRISVRLVALDQRPSPRHRRQQLALR